MPCEQRTDTQNENTNCTALPQKAASPGGPATPRHPAPLPSPEPLRAPAPPQVPGLTRTPAQSPSLTRAREPRGFSARTPLELPLYLSSVAAGFPSPADDYIDQTLDLNEHLVAHPTATFFVRASGDSMLGAGIHNKDILVVDRALDPKNGDVVIAALDGELTVKRISNKGGRVWLLPENPEYKPLEVGPETCFEIWGVVTYVIHKLS